MEAEYFKNKEDILSPSKIKCYKCNKYPTEIIRVENLNYTLFNWIFHGETMYNKYCWDCLPKKNL